MKVALLITTFNRPNYLKDCLWSLERADLSRVQDVVFIDDCSTDPEVMTLLKTFRCQTSNVHIELAKENIGIKRVLNFGYDMLFGSGMDIVINLDSDAIVRHDFVERLLEAYERVSGIITGFNCTTKNANGTDRHKILTVYDFAYWKQSVGGINMCVNKEAYEKCIKPALEMPGNWDHNASIIAGGVWCLKESVIQHIGFDSSMNHNEAPDVADDFYYWDLPTVTLIGVDSQKERLQRSIDICTKWIRFGEVKLLHEPINSKEAYSKFCIEELYKHVKTEHMLICQHDGYVNNWQAWDNDWLQYDYIGAPWHYNDGMAVGNGGFSLRSRRLMEIVATDKNIQIQHPEDHHICRTYRPYLEKTYGIKFAPIEVAEKFSFEGYLQPTKTLSNQFGVHGNRPRVVPAKPIKNDKYIIGQFAGIGDILFLVPLVRELMNEGNTVTWPILKQYFDISFHFPDINFVVKEDYDFPYEQKQVVSTQMGRWLPYRFAIEILGRDLRTCMESKYHLFGHNHNIWRNLYYQRNIERERQLAIELNVPDGNFNFVNRYFGLSSQFKIEPVIKNDYPIIEMQTIPGYTLIDWMAILMKAAEIHIANSSINYLIELSDISVPVYCYKRNLWQEKSFEYTRNLWQNKCWRFVE